MRARSLFFLAVFFYAVPADADEPAPSPPPQKPDEVYVGGTKMSRAGGSAQVMRKEQLERFEYDDPGAVLQQAPSVFVRGEDGVGLRPNIGIRGTNPDRSKKITLMEDGVLFGPAPYSAPAAYYFPLVTRMTQIRVIKGPGAIAYGPHTVGGAIDFISRPIPNETRGSVDLAAGEFGYRKAHAWMGSSDGRFGVLAEGVHLENSGFTLLPNGADTGSSRNDFMVKGAYDLTPDAPTKHRLQVKLSYADEQSNETYLGQTDFDFRTNPYRRYAASALDHMRNHRTGIVATHTMESAGSSYQIKTSAYRFDYHRVWSKLNRMGAGSVASILQNARDPANAGRYAVLTGQIDSGSPGDTLYIGPNDRTFVSQGIQSVMTASARTGPLEHRFETGLRFHYDHIVRRHSEDGYVMRGGELVPTGEAEIVTANNKASTHAVAVHLTDTMTWEKLTLTPGMRVEMIASTDDDYLTRASNDSLVPALTPGIGAFYEFVDDFGVLAGVHRGFSPPPPGSASSTRPEYSVAYEAGARYAHGRTRAELIGFLNDYSNLTDVCTLASGCVTTNLDRQFDAGSAEVYGLEAFGSWDPRVGPVHLPMSLAYTLTHGEFSSSFQSADPIYGNVQAGEYIPYIPLHQLNATAAVEHRRAGFNVAGTFVAPMREIAGREALERTIATDEQFWLDIGGYYQALRWLRLYANLRNVFEDRNIVGRRPYGARVNAPRWLQIGMKIDF